MSTKKTKGLPASSDEFGTPWPLFNELHEEFNFTIDAAASPENAKLPLYVTKEQNAFEYNFSGHRVWCNPPCNGAGTVKRWVSYFSWKTYLGHIPLAVLLVPRKTEQTFFYNLCWNDRRCEVRFVRGRIQFDGGTSSARDSHMVLIFKKGRVWT